MWRVGTKVPVNIYDDDDNIVGQCQSPEYARCIVAAMHFQKSFLNMRSDNLCWIKNTDEAKALPESEFLESCRRYRAQIASERGEFKEGMTIAQLEERSQALAWLEEIVETCLVNIGFEFDGGVFLEIVPLSSAPPTVLREQNSLFEAIQAACSKST